MECIEFFQVFIMCFRSLTYSCSSSSSSAAAAAAADDDDTDIPPLQGKYDVFLSFRGEDTRNTFISHLYEALCRKKIETYIDYRLVGGVEIAPALVEAIQRSTISLIIFSKNYASSSWCLDELVHILECKEKNGQLVIPIFYDISPSDVRKQQGSYALAFRQLEKRFSVSIDKVHKWRAVLTQAADLSGFDDSKKTESEATLVKKVVEDIWIKLNRESSSNLKGLLGIERKIEQIESLLCLDSPGVCCVCIWGMGGIGKTTLADAVFHKLSSKFEVCCFLKDVREKSEKTDGLHQLRNKLVGEILKEKDVNIDTPSIPLHIQDRIRRTKALIVLDDVNARKQLENLVGDDDRFCPGSRIIITTRDRGLLKEKNDVKIFNVERLGSDEALQLFHSDGNKSPTTDNNTDLSREVVDELSREVVDYIKGIPLALKVMGSLFRRCKSKQEWEVQWEKVKRVPIEEIKEVLRISYDGLGKNEKDIFLDIACFHKRYDRNYVKNVLDIRDFHGEAGINDLIDRSLISISKWNTIEMHDLVQEMGRAIVEEQRIKERSRLFNAEEYVYQVLINNQSNEHVEAMSLDLSNIEKQHWELQFANFKKMCRLRWLRVRDRHRLIVSLDLPDSLGYLEWAAYPFKSLPSNFYATGAQLWTEEQSPRNLKWISVRFSKQLTKIPNLSRSPKIEHIDLQACHNLVSLPTNIWKLKSLESLDLSQCSKFQNFPEISEAVEHLKFLNLSGTAVKDLPPSIGNLVALRKLDLSSCKNLEVVPNYVFRLTSLQDLNLSGTEIKSLPASIKQATQLSRLCLVSCKSLESLLELPASLKTVYSLHNEKDLDRLDLSGCVKLQNFPDLSEAMEHLKFLNLSSTAVKEVPPSIGNLVGLQKLNLSFCKNLEVVPDYLFRLPALQDLNLSATKIKSLPASIKQATQLSRLCLDSCMSLEFLPKLPPSLKTVYSLYNKEDLDGLDLSGCIKLQNFPYLSEAMEHLKFLNLSSTAVKEVPSSIGNLVGLRKLNLSFCKNLEVVPDYLFRLTALQDLNLSGTKIKSLPASIKQATQLSRLCLDSCMSLESLPELPPSLKTVYSLYNKEDLDGLDLSGCIKLQNFPYLSEAMEHLKFLNLSSTAVKEVPPSIGNLVRLRKLNLSFCKNLEVVPNYVFRLTALQDLNLSATKIKSLPASIKQATQLSRLCLDSCKSLESLPELPPSLKTVYSLYNDKDLDGLDLSGCVKLQNFPDLSEAMEHLKFLNLSSTAVKEVPPSIGNLVGLRKLNLSFCKNLEVAPDYLFRLTALQDLNLSGTKIKSLPASIKQATQLSRLCLDSCMSLESLPELPPLLQYLTVDGCTSLKTVSSSSAAIIQGWEESTFSYGLREKHIFSECPKLDENARSNIMADAQLRIMRMATRSSKVQEDKFEEKFATYEYACFWDDGCDSWSRHGANDFKEIVAIRCPGYEIPKWFSHQSEGSSIKIDLPRDWFSKDFLGFALSLVVAYKRYGSCFMLIGCKYNFKTSNGESHEVNHPLFHGSVWKAEEYSHDVFLWCYNNVFEEVEEARSFTAFYDRFTEVNVDFNVSWKEGEAEKCGICLLYGKDAEMIKQRALYCQGA